MPTETKQFSSRYNSLPEEVQFYFSSEFSGKIILGLAAAYKVKADYIYDLVFDTVNNDFDFNYLRTGLKGLDLTGPSQKSFLKDFIGEIFLPIAPYIKSKDIRNELVKNSGDPKEYQENTEKFLSLIEEENFKDIDALISLHEKVVDLKEERNYALDLLSNHLLEVLESETLAASATLNSGLIYLLYNDGTFKDEAMRTLFGNSEKLTSTSLVFEDRMVSPSVANWLKDFIKANGSDIFDDLVLAQYLSSSKNAKNLKPAEKDLLRKLLRLYRNLSFFPDSMNGIPEESWEIVPLDKPEEKIKTGTAPDPLEELQAALSEYEPGSLGYKAVQQEISRLQKRK